MKNLTDVTENKDIATKEYVDSAKNIWYGTCSSTAATIPKIVTTDTQDFTLEEGNVIYVQFDNASGNLGDNASQLNVDGTGVINIYSKVGTLGVNWPSGSVVGFVYNGTNFISINKSIANFYWYGETKLDNAIDSTSNTTAATPSAVKQAYDLANGKQDTLVSGTNIKTINSQSLLGSGDLTINVPTKTSDLTNDSGFITASVATATPTADTISKFDSTAHMNSTDMTSSEVTSFVNGLNMTGSKTADYVVEQGTDGMWTYRKWQSGIAECWGITPTTSYAITSTYGSLYYASATLCTFPTNLFISVPIVNIARTPNGGVGTGLVFAAINSVTTTNVAAYIANSTSGTWNFNFSISAKGRWK